MNDIKCKSHIDYPASNGEWVINNGGATLCSFMSNQLDIRIKDESKNLVRYAGITDYYVRNEYGLMYKSCSGVNNIVSGRHVLDPWGRRFKVFPDNSRSNVLYVNSVGYHQYEVYYGVGVYKTVYGDEFKGDSSNIRYNVVLLTTTVHGCVVYCLDILAGAYKHV